MVFRIVKPEDIFDVRELLWDRVVEKKAPVQLTDYEKWTWGSESKGTSH